MHIGHGDLTPSSDVHLQTNESDVKTHPHPTKTNLTNNTSMFNQNNTHCSSMKPCTIEPSEEPTMKESEIISDAHKDIDLYVPKVEGSNNTAASYLAFKAVDTNSISGTPSPRKSGSNNSYDGAPGNFPTASSICTLHAATDLDPCQDAADMSTKDGVDNDSYNLMSSCAELRSMSSKANPAHLGNASSTKNTDHRVDQYLSTNDYSSMPSNTLNQPHLQPSDNENPFLDDHLPLWQAHQTFPGKCYDDEERVSVSGSSSTATSSAVSLNYPKNQQRSKMHPNDVIIQNNNTYTSSSPDTTQFDGYNYKYLNETPTSPELLAYRQQYVLAQNSTNYLKEHAIQNTTNTTTTNSNCHDLKSEISHAGLHSNILEVMSQWVLKILSIDMIWGNQNPCNPF